MTRVNVSVLRMLRVDVMCPWRLRENPWSNWCTALRGGCCCPQRSWRCCPESHRDSRTMTNLSMSSIALVSPRRLWLLILWRFFDIIPGFLAQKDIYVLLLDSSPEKLRFRMLSLSIIVQQATTGFIDETFHVAPKRYHRYLISILKRQNRIVLHELKINC